MFTGIVEEIGSVVAVATSGDGGVLRVATTLVGSDVRHGASVAVDGVCLTVVGAVPGESFGGTADAPADSRGGTVIEFDVMGETLKRSVIGTLAASDRVNLERATPAGGRLDGHIVQGHVDGTGVVLARRPAGQWETVRFGLPSDLARYVAEKGSIAVSGVSLTVTAVGPEWFEVGLIPETLRATTLGDKPVGSAVNLETDVLAKYVARLMDGRHR